jgi:hypothetical protein
MVFRRRFTTVETHGPAWGGEVAGKVFISFASQEVAVVDKLCVALEVRAGEPSAAAIVQAVNAWRLPVLVLVLWKRKRPILAVRMGAGELPLDLEYFALDAPDRFDDAIRMITYVDAARTNDDAASCMFNGNRKRA